MSNVTHFTAFNFETFNWLHIPTMSCCHHNHEQDEDIHIDTTPQSPPNDIFTALDESKGTDTRLDDDATKDILRQFEVVMSARAAEYQTFARCLDAYRETNDAVAYQKTCGDITMRFKGTALYTTHTWHDVVQTHISP